MTTRNQEVLAAIHATLAISAAKRGPAPPPERLAMDALAEAIAEQADILAHLDRAGCHHWPAYAVIQGRLARWTAAWKGNR